MGGTCNSLLRNTENASFADAHCVLSLPRKKRAMRSHSADGGGGNQGDLAVVDAAIDLVLLHHAAQTQTQYLEGDRLDSAKQGRKREYRYSAAPCRRLLSTVCWLREAEMAITGMSTRCRSFFMRFRISSPDMASRSQLISAMSY